MDSWVIAMMLGVSLFLGAIALIAFMWAIKKGQFDDHEKMMNAVLNDGESELQDAAMQDRKKELLKERNKKSAPKKMQLPD